MFTVRFDATFRIAECPASGVEALEFRRANDLPDGADNEQVITVEVTDEATWRAVAAAAPHGDGMADCDWVAHSARRDAGIRLPGGPGDWGVGHVLELPAGVVAVLVAEERSAEALRGALVAVATAYEAAWQQAQAEVEAAREEKIASLVARPDLAWTRERCGAGGYYDGTAWHRVLELGTYPGAGYAEKDAADPRIVAKRASVLAFIDAHNAELRSEVERRAAESKARRAALTAARELLADELAEAAAVLAAETERADLLADIVAALPPDALTGVLRQRAEGQAHEQIATMRAAVMAAAGLAEPEDGDEDDEESEEE